MTSPCLSGSGTFRYPETKPRILAPFPSPWQPPTCSRAVGLSTLNTPRQRGLLRLAAFTARDRASPLWMAECRPFTHAGRVLHLGCCGRAAVRTAVGVFERLFSPRQWIAGSSGNSVAILAGNCQCPHRGHTASRACQRARIPTSAGMCGPAMSPVRSGSDCHSLMTPCGERPSMPLLAACVFEMSAESLPAGTGLPSCSCSVRILRMFCKLDSSESQCAHIFFHSNAVFSLP